MGLLLYWSVVWHFRYQFSCTIGELIWYLCVVVEIEQNDVFMQTN